MSNFDHLGDRVSAWIDGELIGDELDHAAAHLDQCEHCRSVVDAERTVRSWIRLLPQEEPPPGFLDKIVLTGPRDRRSDRRRVRFGVANLVASAAVWVLVLGVGQLSNTSTTVTPRVGSFVTTHQANVVSTASFGSVDRQMHSTRSDLPPATSRFDLVAFRTDSSMTQAVYSDGVDAVSVFRQVGALDWDAVGDGRAVSVGESRGVVIDRGDVEVLMFERGDYAYAVVAPPSSGVIDEIAVAMPSSPGPSLWDRATDAGRGLLDCFGLRG
ncbi:MAG: anti-sigma factor [Acidimicrobiia bacterium]